ncbi:MAG: Isoleucyl-tRNA synthetase [Treponematales bacterium]
MYHEVNPKQSFPALEEGVLAFWRENGVFEKSIAQREGAPDFTFYDGPPFATGLPHFGHFVPGTIKDIIPRYKTMRGFRVERRFGWDCHGLPVENLVEKELALGSKTDIEKYGVAKFNEACRASVLRYVAEWRRIVSRLGRWVDFDRDYKTMESAYMESIWAVVKALHERGLLYEGHYILPYCPRCATVLSNHEVAGSYQDVDDPAITIPFKVIGNVKAGNGDSEGGPSPSTYLLAWTTTPWTLPSNLALTVGPDIDYVCVEDGDERYILAEARLGSYYKAPPIDCTGVACNAPAGGAPAEVAPTGGAAPRIISRFKGAGLVGLEYEPLFPYFAAEREHNAFRVYPGDFVSTEDGTGIVHTAPGFGEDDQRVLRGSGIPTLCPVDAECRFTADVPDYAGRFVKDCDKDIIARLKAEGRLVKREQIEHSYPHCWRCGRPLIYRAVGSWFVNVQKIKADMLAANQEINWVPEHIKNGRFGKWLEGARDWAISRNRYWGNPLPVWRCDTCGKIIVVGSRAELARLARLDKEPADIHKHFVDSITIPCECGGVMRRVPEVLDCWFESGSMPYAQSHYPFENKEFFESHFPADFINEGLDQTRGWFYTLTVLAAALFKRPAFKNCVVSGLVLAEDGKKMSKSLRNFTDPMEVVNTFGADALRLFLIHSAVVKADDLRYSDEGVKEVLKSIILPLWNAYSFFVTYANIDGVTVDAPPPPSPANPLDKWILSAAQTLVERVTSALDAYDLSRAIDPILAFIDNLNNWYIRRSRRRFWRTANDSDKLEAYACLHYALKTLITVAAPFIPFTTEAIWGNIVGNRVTDNTLPISVHLADWPTPNSAYRDSELEFKMGVVQKAVSMGRALRAQYNIKVRQPLRMVEVVTRDSAAMAALLEMEDITKEELNVKQVIFRDNEEDLVEYEAKANFRVLGKELAAAGRGADMRAAAARIAAFTQTEIQGLLDGASLSLDLGGGAAVNITADKLDVRRVEKASLKVLNEGALTVALDTEITEELSREGDVRDLVRGIQNLRKETGLEVTDRIALTLSGSPRLKAAWEAFDGYVSAETLAASVSWKEVPGMTELEAGNEKWKMKVEKA